MKGHDSIIGALNRVLTAELTSINQFFLHARIFKNWGFASLDQKAYKKSIRDMKQADELIERILFLEGLPNLQHLEKIRIGEHTEEILQCDMDIQTAQLSLLRDSIELCESERDYVSRDLLAGILEYEEEYLDWLETQHHLIGELGLENYQQSQISSNN